VFTGARFLDVLPSQGHKPISYRKERLALVAVDDGTQ